MRPRLTVLVVAAALLAVAFVPAAKASGGVEDPAITGTLTYLTFDTTHGTVRGVFANFNLLGFTAEHIDPSTPGGIVVRLLDTSTPPRTISQVSLRADALDDPGVPEATSNLTAPIDSVWGSFDYAADGYWTQPRNLRINGGNCEQIGGAEVTIRVTAPPGGAVTGNIEGPPRGSCDDIRR